MELFGLTLTLVAACIALTVARQFEDTSGLGDELQSLLRATVDDSPDIQAVALHVIGPGIEFTWQGAAGFADPATATPMTPQHPVRIASNTKTFVAAAILRLDEDGRLNLDDPISQHLSDDSLELLRGDGYHQREISIRHLLTHTSGLYDHSASENYERAIVADPMHRWTRREQLQAAMEWGDRLGAPGEIYSYCDTGYILLGEVLEQTTGSSLADAVRDLVGFERLGLSSTWWEILEPRPAGVPDRAHQFLGDLDVTGFDPSYDLYGGGGLVSTMRDLAHFFRALFTGGVYTNRTSAGTMLTTLEGARQPTDADDTALPVGAYRMGVWVEELDGLTVYRHGGFWGTTAAHAPKLDLTVTATVNQNRGKADLESLVRTVFGLIRERVEEKTAHRT